MDSGELTKTRAKAANLYAARQNPVNAGSVTRNNRVIAASQAFIAPYSQSNYRNAPYCPPLLTGGPASDYGDSRLDNASFTGSAINTFMNVLDRRTGDAVCNGPPPASILPQGISLDGDCSCKITLPGPPIITSVIGDDETLIVYFIPPIAGSSPIIRYEYSIGGDFISIYSTNSPFTITGLANGITYTVTLRAITADGIGPVSSPASGMPVGPPYKPHIDHITPGDTILIVYFDPVNDGGSPITFYEISTTNGQQWDDVGLITSPYTITGLTNEVPYQVVIRAYNALGASEESNMVEMAPAKKPDAPTITSVVTGDTRLIVNYTVPYDGGTPILYYKISKDNGANYTSIGLPQTPTYTLTGLNNAQTYYIRMLAVNAAGESLPSNMVEGTPIGPPTSPNISAVNSGDQTLTVVFTPPTFNGGAPITYYELSTNGKVSWNNVGLIESPFTINYLENGITYNIALRAGNDVAGARDWSNVVPGTPSTKPEPPIIDYVTSDDEKLIINFTPGFNGGSEILYYLLSADGGFTWNNVGKITSPYTLLNLQNGTTYYIVLKSVNKNGESDPSNIIEGTPIGPPTSPNIISVASGNQFLTMAFTPPAFDGGAPITFYELSTDGKITWTNLGLIESPYIIYSLENGITYNIALRAGNNIAGARDWSNVVPGIPIGPPTEPVIVSPLGRGDGFLTMQFSVPFDGGAPIQYYELSIDGGGSWNNVGLITSPYKIENLQNGTTYYITIQATNIAGTSLPAIPVEGKPARKPDPPIIFGDVQWGDGELTISFYVEYDGGEPIIGYQLTKDNGANWTNVGDITSPYTLTGLINGQTYYIGLKAINVMGISDPSNIVSGTPLAVPSQPVIVSPLGRGDQYLTMSYTIASDGGTPIFLYQLSLDGGSSWLYYDFLPSPYTIENLQNGTTYSVTLQVTNAVGTSLPAIPVEGKPARKPDSPFIFEDVQWGDSQLTISFDIPYDGGEPIIGYQLTKDNGTNWTNVGDITSPYTLTGLVNGQTYYIGLKAINVMGISDPSNIVSGTPIAVPSQPVIASPLGRGDQYLTMSYTIASDGGSPIFLYQLSLDGGSSWMDYGFLPSPYTIENLQNGTTYNVTLQVTNAAGTSLPAIPVEGKPARKPDPPIIFEDVQWGDSQLTINFKIPYDGGEPITGYQLTKDNGNNWTNVGNISSPYTLTGLVNGQLYQIGLKAINIMGISNPSNIVSGIPLAVPSQPIIASPLGRGDQYLTMSYTIASDGGSPIFLYQLSLDGGSSWLYYDFLPSPYTIENLQNGTTYSVTLQVTNAVGTSLPAIPVEGKPATKPDPPIISEDVQWGDSQLTISFDVPYNGGEPITGYQLTKDNGANWTNVGDITSPYTLTGLVNGQTYYIGLKAINVMGTSDPSNIVSGTPFAVPSQPTIDYITPGYEELYIKFTPPVSDGGSAILYYELSKDNGISWEYVGLIESPYTLSGLINGTTYQVILRAVNDIGIGVPSNMVPGTPADAMIMVLEPTIPNTTFNLPFTGIPGKTITVNWGNGSIITYTYSITGIIDVNYTYTSPGTYIISCTGTALKFDSTITFFQGVQYLTRVVYWGPFAFQSFQGAFQNAFKLVSVPSYIPSSVTDTSYMFRNAVIFNQSLNDWDVTNVTNMSDMFSDARAFNGDISNWNVGNVTNMENMFKNASAFNCDLTYWNVGSVTNMKSMFSGASIFNGNITNWNVGNVTNMNQMFSEAYKFNKDLTYWNVINVTDMSYMFYKAYEFNGKMSNWNMGLVPLTMAHMFRGAISFNQDISAWNVGRVTDMNNMFAMDNKPIGSTPKFNQNLENWNTQNVTNMSLMFFHNSAFNGNISNWNVGNVINMFGMFYNATEFNKDLSKWNVGKVRNMALMFCGAIKFTSDLSSWNVGLVETMDAMFEYLMFFNANLSSWNVINVKTMMRMFSDTQSFNSPLNWGSKTANVTNMEKMFNKAKSFYQDISGWNVAKVTNAEQIFCQCPLLDNPAYYPSFSPPPIYYGCDV